MRQYIGSLLSDYFYIQRWSPLLQGTCLETPITGTRLSERLNTLECYKAGISQACVIFPLSTNLLLFSAILNLRPLTFLKGLAFTKK